MRINLSENSAKNSKLKFVTALIRLFAEENDIKFGKTVQAWIATPPGAKALATWAQKVGFKAEYWSMEPLKIQNEYSNPPNRVQVIWVGFGIDIDEKDPKIVELKLKN